MKRCNQCWKTLPASAFKPGRGKDGLQQDCIACRGKYNGWHKKSLDEKLRTRAPRKDPKQAGRVLFTLRSGNAKTGPIPITISERGTCPSACAFYEGACYAEYHKLGWHWRLLSEGKRGIPWAAFLDKIAGLPEGQLWRHNEAGDLAGEDGNIDRVKLAQLVAANAGRRGFTYTHKPMFRRGGVTVALANVMAVDHANKRGFTINLSADTISEADKLRALEIAPVVLTVPVDAVLPRKTPGGHRLVMCPAQTNQMTCEECGLCAEQRKSIVVFRAHGQAVGMVTELLRRKRDTELRV